MTIAMLSLAGIPATAGFWGKFYLINAAVAGGYTWLGIVLVVGSMISLAYYLRVIAAMWMREAPSAQALVARPAMAGGSPEADDEGGGVEEEGGEEEESDAEEEGGEEEESDAEEEGGEEEEGAEWPEKQAAQPSRANPEVTAVAVLFGAASLFFGIIPSPLFDLARDAGAALGLL